MASSESSELNLVSLYKFAQEMQKTFSLSLAIPDKLKHEDVGGCISWLSLVQSVKQIQRQCDLSQELEQFLNVAIKKADQQKGPSEQELHVHTIMADCYQTEKLSNSVKQALSDYNHPVGKGWGSGLLNSLFVYRQKGVKFGRVSDVIGTGDMIPIFRELLSFIKLDEEHGASKKDLLNSLAKQVKWDDRVSWLPDELISFKNYFVKALSNEIERLEHKNPTVNPESEYFEKLVNLSPFSHLTPTLNALYYFNQYGHFDRQLNPTILDILDGECEWPSKERQEFLDKSFLDIKLFLMDAANIELRSYQKSSGFALKKMSLMTKFFELPSMEDSLEILSQLKEFIEIGEGSCPLNRLLLKELIDKTASLELDKSKITKAEMNDICIEFKLSLDARCNQLKNTKEYKLNKEKERKNIEAQRLLDAKKEVAEIKFILLKQGDKNPDINTNQRIIDIIFQRTTQGGKLIWQDAYGVKEFIDYSISDSMASLFARLNEGELLTDEIDDKTELQLKQFCKREVHKKLDQTVVVASNNSEKHTATYQIIRNDAKWQLMWHSVSGKPSTLNLEKYSKVKALLDGLDEKGITEVSDSLLYSIKLNLCHKKQPTVSLKGKFEQVETTLNAIFTQTHVPDIVSRSRTSANFPPILVAKDEFARRKKTIGDMLAKIFTKQEDLTDDTAESEVDNSIHPQPQEQSSEDFINKQQMVLDKLFGQPNAGSSGDAKPAITIETTSSESTVPPNTPTTECKKASSFVLAQSELAKQLQAGMFARKPPSQKNEQKSEVSTSLT